MLLNAPIAGSELKLYSSGCTEVDNARELTIALVVVEEVEVLLNSRVIPVIERTYNIHLTILQRRNNLRQERSYVSRNDVRHNLAARNDSTLIGYE